MLRKEDKDKIFTLRKSKLSTCEIARRMNTSRSTVSRVLIKNGMGSYVLSDIKTEKLDEELLGEFLGIFAGDGSYYKSVYNSGHKYITRLYFSYDEKGYAIEIQQILEKLFKKKPFLYENKKYNVVIIRYNSRKLGEFLRLYLKWDKNKTQTICLKKLKHGDEFLRGFLRGFIDSDGYVDKDQKRASMFCISKNMMKQINDISRKFKFNPNFYTYNDKRLNRRPMHFVNFTDKDAKQFIEFVKPRNPKRIRNGLALI